MILVSNMLSMYSSGSSGSSKDGTLTITLPKTDYLFGETFSLTGAHVIYTPRHGNAVDVTNEVITNNSITPADNYVWDVSGEQTVRAYYTKPDGTILYGSLVVKVAEEGKGYITVSTSKDTYVHGDQFNTSVLTITYTSIAGVETNIDPGSAYVTISPENGDIFDIDGQNTITVVYDYVAESGSETAENPAPGYVKVNVKPAVNTMTLKLAQTGCTVNDHLNYAGSRLTITYTDGTRKVVIFGDDADEDEKVTWDPYDDTVMDEAGDVTITATYTEDGYSVEASSYVKVSTASLESITFSLSSYSFNHGDTIDYDSLHLKATAVYSDASTRDVTQYVVMSPDRGTWMTTDRQVTATYTENNVTQRYSRNITVSDVLESLSVSLGRTSYKVGNSITYAGSLCVLLYASGREQEIGASGVSWSPVEGTVLNDEGAMYVTASYPGVTSVHAQINVTDETNSSSVVDPDTGETKEVTEDESGNVTEKVIPSSIRIKTPPNTTTYDHLETISYVGIEVEMLDKDGEPVTPEGYSSSIIPFSELDFPITTARHSGGEEPGTSGFTGYMTYTTTDQTAYRAFKTSAANNGYTIVSDIRTRDSNNVYHYTIKYYNSDQTPE